MSDTNKVCYKDFLDEISLETIDKKYFIKTNDEYLLDKEGVKCEFENEEDGKKKIRNLYSFT